MRPRAVAVAHRQTMVAEGLRAALGSFPAIATLGAATNVGHAERIAEHADAVALDMELAGAAGAAARLRRRGVRVVWIGPSAGDDDEVRVAPEQPMSVLAEALVPGAVRPSNSPLSAQQRRVLTLVAQGMTARQVARCLSISEKTVEQHKHRIFQKLGVPNQAAAVRVSLVLDMDGAPA